MKGLKVWHWGLCTVYIYPQSEIVKNSYLSGTNKEVEVNHKRHAGIRIWVFASKWHQPPDPHFISESYFSLFFCGTTPSGQFIVGLVPTEEIKKRCQEYAEELYKEGPYKLDNHSGVITHLEPVILECEVQGAIGSITRSKVMEVMEFLLSYFKS